MIKFGGDLDNNLDPEIFYRIILSLHSYGILEVLGFRGCLCSPNSFQVFK